MFSKASIHAAGAAADEEDGELPRSNHSGGSKRGDSDDKGSTEEESKRRKLLDVEISKADIKMRADINSYLSVSDSDREEETKAPKKTHESTNG